MEWGWKWERVLQKKLTLETPICTGIIFAVAIVISSFAVDLLVNNSLQRISYTLAFDSHCSFSETTNVIFFPPGYNTINDYNLKNSYHTTFALR